MTRPKTPTAGIAPTVSALAAAVGRSPSTIRNWIDAGCPRLPSGGFDIPSVLRWRSGQAGQGGTRRPTGLDADGSPADLALLHLRRARVAKLRAANTRLARSLVRASTIPALTAARVAALRALLAEHSTTIAPRLVGLDSRKTIDLLRRLDGVLVDALHDTPTHGTDALLITYHRLLEAFDARP